MFRCYLLRKQKLLGTKVFDYVAEFDGAFEFEFLGGFAHVGFEVGDVGVEFGPVVVGERNGANTRERDRPH